MLHLAEDGANENYSRDLSIDSSSKSASELGSARPYRSGPDFLDTNVLVYANDASEPVKQRISQELVRRAVAGEMVTSTHVLAEFAVTLLHKRSPAAQPADVLTS